MEQLKIVMVRHGKPSSASNVVVDALGFKKWVRDYDLSGVDTKSVPTTELQLEIENSYSVSSDLNRALHSARLCTHKEADCVLKELREFDIPCFDWPFRFSVNKWLLFSRLSWYMNIVGKSESRRSGQKRLTKAVDLIEEKSREQPSVAIFGHGLANRFVAAELKRRGWTLLSSGSGYWGVTRLVKDLE
ncbi:histidine phosphatase family protein [Vibrio sp. S9_S30]|uniref:histidine phosphatase family protein n=1 Tax=Vibrio sp. S9_S30 TaxID=2720226 RepID=UPI001681AD6C|nr:histidine phosphatase family protein [Vibrio sp. S9_S30]MBD1557819.1 histidine phosphatase family protein [Vibrio sp. S9_S30]